MHELEETIVAVATPAGRGGIGVVRVSGPQALTVVTPFLKMRRPLAAGRAQFGEVIDTASGQILDEAVVTYFAGPRSYTGEDVVEVAAHGAPVILDYLLRACCARGARLAEPGEFTQRAFLSGRLDLTQAEAVGDLIAAGTLEQARVAARQLGGALAQEIKPVKEALVGLIAEIEAGIDFAEDDVSVLSGDAIVDRIVGITEPLVRLERSFSFGRVVREGFTLALVGRPNVGKSSLFNRLLERERSIVTAAPGTTRDTVSERVSLNGIPVELVDTAGLRIGVEDIDEAEQLGMERSGEAMAEANLVVLVLDARLPLAAEDSRIVEACSERGLVVAVNKVDLLGKEDSVAEASLSNLGSEGVRISALTGEGLEQLRRAILAAITGSEALAASAMVTNLRQWQTTTEAVSALKKAEFEVGQGIPHEMVLVALYESLRRLDALTGSTTTEDVLRLIFHRFCVGK